VAAVRRAVAGEPHFAEWLAHTLATAVCDHPDGIDALIGGSGSWESGAVRQLIEGTVGHDEEYLADYRTWPGGPDDNPAQTRA
jgi:hypothetical protein